MWRFLKRLVKWAAILAILLVILVPIGLAAMLVQRNSLLAAENVATPAKAAEARAFVRELRRVSQETEGEQTVVATDAELEGLIATSARLVPGLRGRATTTAETLTLVISAPVPGGLWANAAMVLGPSGPTPDLRLLRLGRVDVPRGYGAPLARGALDLLTAEDLGTVLFGALRSLDTRPGEVTVVVDGGGLGGGSLFDRGMAGVRDLLGLEAGPRAAAIYDALAAEAAAGDLPRSGSALPWLRRAVEIAAEGPHESGRAARRDLRAALLAFAAHCGDLVAIETFAGEIGAAGASACAETTLRGRLDLRKHFALSAAFAAAGTSAAAWGLGEVKELVDAGRADGSGFSFDDVALDRAGIRFAERLRRARPEELAALPLRLEDEASVTPSIDGLPSFMSEADFTARFGGVDDPRYARQLAEIDARIDALPFHAR